MKRVLFAELNMSEAIVRDGNEVIPRFRVMTPDGHYVLLMPLSDVAADRHRRIRLAGLFMAWKMATGFVLSGELHEPDAITAFAIARAERHGMMRLISRGPPISFGRITSLESSDVEPGLIALLPRGETTMTVEMVAELGRVFGKGGEMPAMRVG